MRTQIHTTEQPESDISAFFLSCDRLDLLNITISSFLNTVNESVKLVLCDDSANPEVFPYLVNKYSNFDIICFPENRGQWAQYDFMSSYCFTKYLFYVEDDWEFIKSGYMQLSKRILEQDRLIGSVDLTEPICKDFGCIGEETEDFYYKKPWRISSNHLWWNSWMGSPNLKRREDYIKLGRIENLTPEWVLDRKFNSIGLKGVWAKDCYVKHIGYGHSRMEGKRPNDTTTPCQLCDLKNECKLKVDWFNV